MSWEERLARAYESKLFKEFALVRRLIPCLACSHTYLAIQIDLKHFKSRRLALRWRTAPEVVEGIGEDTCASLRCKHHRANPMSPERVAFDTPQSEKYRHEAEQRRRGRMPSLRSFELPFVYEEGGARREALVKVKLCGRCAGKLCWKPGDERGISGKAEGHVGSDVDEDELDGTGRMAGDGKGGRDSQRDRENTDRHRREQEPARRGDERLAQVKASEGDRRTHEDHAREREMVERRAPEGRSLRASRSRSPRRRTQDAKI